MRSFTSSAARSSTREATPPSRSRSSSRPAPSGRPRSRPARRPASTRPSSCATAATATAARACRPRSASSTTRSPARSAGSMPSTSAASTASCSTSTAPTTRRGSAPTRSSAPASPWPRPPPTTLELPLYRYVGGTNAHVLPVPMMNVLNGGVHADNNVDFQEFMIMPVGAPSFSRGAALGHADLPRAQGGAARQGPRDRGRRRGWLRPRPRLQRGGDQAAGARRSSAAGFTPGDDIAIALDPAASEIYRDGAYHLDGEGKVARPPTRWPTTGPRIVDTLPDRLDRGRHGRGRLGRAGRRSPQRSATAARLVGDDLFVTNSRAARSAASTRRSPTRSSSRSTRSAR